MLSLKSIAVISTVIQYGWIIIPTCKLVMSVLTGTADLTYRVVKLVGTTNIVYKVVKNIQTLK